MHNIFVLKSPMITLDLYTEGCTVLYRDYIEPDRIEVVIHNPDHPPVSLVYSYSTDTLDLKIQGLPTPRLYAQLRNALDRVDVNRSASLQPFLNIIHEFYSTSSPQG